MILMEIQIDITDVEVERDIDRVVGCGTIYSIVDLFLSLRLHELKNEITA